MVFFMDEFPKWHGEVQQLLHSAYNKETKVCWLLLEEMMM